MSEIQIDPRWRVQIEGDASDIADLEHVLNSAPERADDYLVQWLLWPKEPIPVLLTTRWDPIGTDVEVFAQAETALRLFSGCLNVYNACGPLKGGTIFERTPEGIVQSRFTTVTITAKKPEADRISSQEFRQIIRHSQQRGGDWLNSCFIEIAGVQNWFSLYRAIEALESYFGNEGAMRQSALVNGAALKKVKRMANSHRHLPRPGLAPPRPIELSDAYKIVIEAIGKISATLP